MDSRCYVLLVALTAGLVVGCDKPKSESREPADGTRGISKPAGPAVEPVARIHWLGKKRLATHTNAVHLMSIWNLPESEKLGRQTLDKLALAPWRLLKGDAATNGAPTTLLRALLDDSVQEESYFEVRNPTNRPGELVYAIRLDAERAGLWLTNLAAVMESLIGMPVAPTKDGWSLRKPDAFGEAELVRRGEWTVLGLAREKNTLLADILSRIDQIRSPYAVPPTNQWLTLTVDLKRMADALSLNWQFPDNWPAISLAVTGDGVNVQTRGALRFSKPVELDLEPWNIPTNLIHDPLVGFTAIRGLRPWLSSYPIWPGLELGEPPNQVYLWGLGATPFQTYGAVPSGNASNQVFQLAQRLVDKGNLWLQDHAIGKFAPLEGANGVRWVGLPFITPVLQTAASGNSEFVKLSFFPAGNTNRAMPIELLYAILTPTNLVGYDWEITASRFDGWTGVGQALRIGLDRPRMPAGSAGMTWLRAIKSKLGNSTTGVLLEKPDKLVFVRNSSMGLTAIELHLLADWLESPRHPAGVHTLLAPSDLPWRKLESPSPPQQP